MRLVHLRTHAFRNLVGTDLGTDARFVVVHGPNAQGKTNLLEAAWLLATLRPLRGARVRELVALGTAAATISGTVRHDGISRRLSVELESPRRRALVDGEPIRELGEYFAWVRAIAFQPSDAAIVTEGPAERRAWLDRAAFTAHPVHLDRVRTVQRLLDHKGAVLRQDRPDAAVLDVLDAQLAAAGSRLVEARARTLAELAPHVADEHAAIAGAHGELRLEHRTDATGSDERHRETALRGALAEARRDEVAQRRSLVGPQRDEIRLTLDGHAARTFGSRGQVRSIVLAMKLAELVAARARGQAPLFLVDDLSSELDRGRTERLVERLVGLDAQVWVSTTDPSPLDVLPAGEVLRVRMAEGVSTSEGPPARG